MKFDTVVKNGIIVNSTGQQRADLCIRGGRVAALLCPGEEWEAEAVYDAEGRYVMPGAIDPHVHAGVGDPDRETVYCASCAAAAGGVTTILEQPLSTPPTVTVKAFLEKKEYVSGESVVDFGLWGGLVPGNYGELAGLFQQGGRAYKSFMCRCSNYPMSDDGTLLAGMRRIGRLGGLSAVHAENDTLIQQPADEYAARGKKDVSAFLSSHAEYTELEAIKRYLFLAKQAPGCKAHIVHMSLADGAEAIAEAKAEGVDISVETCPQYLGLCEDDLRALGGVCKCDPPVRSRENVERLWQHVIGGTIDMLASDHSPHSFAKKCLPEDQFDRVAEGVTGLQSLVPVALTEGVHRRGMTLQRLTQLTSLAAAKRFGLYPQKGELAVGADADFYILDLNREWECRAEDLHYLNKHTPYEGKIFKGYIEKTFVRGTLVCENNEMKAGKGFGRFYELKIGRNREEQENAE